MKNITYFIHGGRINHGSKINRTIPNQKPSVYVDKIKIPPTLIFGLDEANLQNDSTLSNRRPSFNFAPQHIIEE